MATNKTNGFMKVLLALFVLVSLASYPSYATKQGMPFVPTYSSYYDDVTIRDDSITFVYLNTTSGEVTDSLGGGNYTAITATPFGMATADTHPMGIVLADDDTLTIDNTVIKGTKEMIDIAGTRMERVDITNSEVDPSFPTSYYYSYNPYQAYSGYGYAYFGAKFGYPSYSPYSSGYGAFGVVNEDGTQNGHYGLGMLGGDAVAGAVALNDEEHWVATDNQYLWLPFSKHFMNNEVTSVNLENTIIDEDASGSSLGKNIGLMVGGEGKAELSVKNVAITSNIALHAINTNVNVTGLTTYAQGALLLDTVTGVVKDSTFTAVPPAEGGSVSQVLTLGESNLQLTNNEVVGDSGTFSAYVWEATDASVEIAPTEEGKEPSTVVIENLVADDPIAVQGDTETIATVTVTGTAPPVTYPTCPDVDGDGVNECIDKCPGTVQPEGIPTISLNPNHFAAISANNIFQTKTDGIVVDSQHSLADAFGCSCEQILFCKPGADQGELKFGCSPGTMDVWLAQTGWSLDCQVDGKVAIAGEDKDALEDTDSDGIVDLIDTDMDNDNVPNSQESEQESVQNNGKPDWWCNKHSSKC